MTRAEFQQTNQELRDKRLELVDIEKAIRLKVKELLSWEQTQMADICEAKDSETGKPIFSNPEKRNAELAIRQTSSADWAEMDESAASLRRQAAKLKIDVSFLSNDIQYGINHAADEVNDMLRNIAATVDKAVNVAAFNAVKHLVADFALRSIEKAEATEDEFRKGDGVCP